MKTPKQHLNSTLKRQLENIYYQLIVDTTSVRQAQVIFSNLLTEDEFIIVLQRLAVAIYLDKGRSEDNIQSNLKVSKKFISSVRSQMGDPGIQLALRKIKAEAWADGWTQKISNFIKRFSLAK